MTTKNYASMSCFALLAFVGCRSFDDIADSSSNVGAYCDSDVDCGSSLFCIENQCVSRDGAIDDGRADTDDVSPACETDPQFRQYRGVAGEPGERIDDLCIQACNAIAFPAHDAACEAWLAECQRLTQVDSNGNGAADFPCYACPACT